MKLVGALPVLLAIPAFAQSSASYGTRIGQVQTVYLADIPNTAGIILSGSARFGEIPDAARLGAPTPLPKAEFETWTVHRSRDFAESVVTGNTGVERAGGKATVHRFARDNFRNTNLTYTMTFEALLGTELFRVTFSDSSIPVPFADLTRRRRDRTQSGRGRTHGAPDGGLYPRRFWNDACPPGRRPGRIRRGRRACDQPAACSHEWPRAAGWGACHGQRAGGAGEHSRAGKISFIVQTSRG